MQTHPDYRDGDYSLTIPYNMTSVSTITTRPDGTSNFVGQVYFETSTNKLIFWNSSTSAWVELHSDGTGSYEAGSLLTEDEQPIVTENETPIILE